MNLVKFHKQKSHIVYKTKGGERVPGASTVSKIGSDPEALIAWSWKCGTEGLDYRKVRDGAADVGSLVHFLIQSFLRGEEADLSEFSVADQEKAMICFTKFLIFWEQENLTAIATEVPFVSETYRYGGTLDTVATDRDGRVVLLDYKSSKAVYWEMLSQLSAYEMLWNEHSNGDMQVNRRAIVRIGKLDPINDFEYRWLPGLQKEFSLFRAQLELYYKKKEAGV